MANLMTPKVTKHTRAPRDGRMIYCPKCGVGHRTYGFDWLGGTCQSCWQMVYKLEYFVEPPSRKELPRKLPPIFKADADDYWMLYNGEGSYSGIAVEYTGKPGGWEPCQVIDGKTRIEADSIAQGKTLAMRRLKDRKHG